MTDAFVRSGTVRLRDGRQLGYAEHGDPHGAPVLVFHGTPGSRLSRHPDAGIASRLGARVITVDRPGFGLSDYQPGRTLLDWPADVAELADALDLPSFAVIGISGGGPYAAACAYALPQRVSRAALVCSPAPPAPGQPVRFQGRNRLVFTLADKQPWLLYVLVGLMARQMPRTPEQLAAQFRQSLPPCDAALLDLPGLPDIVLDDTREAFRPGIRGTVHDLRLAAKPWGFDPAAIAVPTLLWHGELDANVPVAMGRYLANAIPGCRATFVPDAGHLIYIPYWADILSGVLTD